MIYISYQFYSYYHYYLDEKFFLFFSNFFWVFY